MSQLPQLFQNDQFRKAVVTWIFTTESHGLRQFETGELPEANSATGVPRNTMNHVRVHDREVTRLPCEFLKLATLPDHIGFDVGVDRVRMNAFRMPCQQARDNTDGVNTHLRPS